MTGSDWSAGVSAGAAVVQAVFSVVAILAAGRIAGKQQAHAAAVRAEEAELHARDVAIQIAPGMQMWAERASRWLDGLNCGGVAAFAALGQIADDVGVISIPKVVADMNGEYRRLGRAAHAVQRAVVAQAKLRDAAPFIASFWAQAALGRGAADAQEEHFATVRHYCEAVVHAARKVIAVRDS